jgi:hypothetical protein
MAATVDRLEVVDPESGEVVNLADLPDADLDELHMLTIYYETQWRLMSQDVMREIARRVRERGGMDSPRRTWKVKRIEVADATLKGVL